MAFWLTVERLNPKIPREIRCRMPKFCRNLSEWERIDGIAPKRVLNMFFVLFVFFVRIINHSFRDDQIVCRRRSHCCEETLQNYLKSNPKKFRKLNFIIKTQRWFTIFCINIVNWRRNKFTLLADAWEHSLKFVKPYRGSEINKFSF